MKWSKYVKPYWKYFILGPLCMIVEVVGEIVMPKLYSQILNVGVETHNVGYIVLTCLLMILTAVLMMVGGVGGAYFGAKASVNFAADLRADVYARVQAFSFAKTAVRYVLKLWAVTAPTAVSATAILRIILQGMT